MSNRSRKIAIVITVLLIAGGTAAFFVVRSHSFQVGYHKRSMQRAWDAVYAEPDTHQDGLVGYTLGEEYERYEYHRAKLIQLGAVLELNYHFQQIMQPSDEGKHITRFIMSSERPDCIDATSPYPKEPKPMQWTVWCYPPDKSAWDQLMSSLDIPDYKAKFMK